MNAFPRRRDQGCTVEDRVGEVVENFDVLTAVAADRDLNLPSVWRGERFARSAAKPARRHLISGEHNSAFFAYDFPLFRGDLEAIGSRSFPGRRDKDAGGAVLEFE